jgi:Cu(I)/Ag(I) efflux system protein CusF
MKSLCLVLLAMALAASPLAALATSHDKSAQFAEGEVRKVDKETGKITLKHGPIANLDMPAMSMVFQVKDWALLDQVKAGDKIRFQAEKIGSQYTVTHIEAAK